MALVSYNNVGISALAACVPSRIINNYEYDLDIWPKEEVKKVVDKVGVFERRFVDENTCASDLCLAAAEKLIADNDIDRSEIDLLVFLSQTPDYRMPATSILLQHRLGLPMTTMAFDISLGCSGFISALSIVYAMMQNNGFRKALLLNGETRSKVYSRKDRREAFIFESFRKAGVLVIDRPYEGHDFSSFGLPRDVEVPKDIKRLMAAAGEDIHSMDYYVFHQANAFINNYIAKKMKLDRERIPWTIQKYGNTSSVSVPLTIVSELKDKMQGEKKLMLSAFGVGMAWATAIVPFMDCKISDIVEI